MVGRFFFFGSAWLGLVGLAPLFGVGSPAFAPPRPLRALPLGFSSAALAGLRSLRLVFVPGLARGLCGALAVLLLRRVRALFSALSGSPLRGACQGLLCYLVLIGFHLYVSWLSLLLRYSLAFGVASAHVATWLGTPGLVL